jgi:HAMP domain-containing protein
VPGTAGTWKDLTGNVNLLAANLTNQVRAIAEVATAVTKGDLTRSIQVEARGEVADLKDNINTMIDNLRATTERNEEQDWLKTNLARFTGMLQGQRDLVTVGRMLLSELAPLVNAQHGTVYQMESSDERPDLTLLASYAAAADSRSASRSARAWSVSARSRSHHRRRQRRPLQEDHRRRPRRDPAAQGSDQHDGRPAARLRAEVTRVAREVGTEGKLGGQAVVPGVAGTWKDLTDSVNAMASNLTAQVRNIAGVTTAVARGDLSRKITVDVKGEILELKDTINTMVDQLNAFASEGQPRGARGRHRRQARRPRLKCRTSPARGRTSPTRSTRWAPT